jgi:catechol 2,3-dioxygenase-like lactoylglutathione lyase family enzyme
MQATTMTTDITRVLKDAPIFASFAVKNLDAARTFYESRLGLDVRDNQEMGVFEIRGRGGQSVLVYPKPDHQPAVFTVLNLEVQSIDEAVDGLTGAGIEMEHYTGENGITTDQKGIARGADGKGPGIGWFRDPSGNIVSVTDSSMS